jgi:Spy/CpxP family protein refolding chaperone
MKKYLLASALMLAMFATQASAQSAEDAGSPPPPPPSHEDAGGPPHDGGHEHGKPFHHWTLDEARKHAHERAEQLDKMTPDQYAKEQEAREEKWRERRADWKKRHAEGAAGNQTAPATH